MPRLTVIVTEEIDVPEGSVVVLAPTGIVESIRLPDGIKIKPWMSFEECDKDENHRTLDEDDLLNMNVDVGLTYNREVIGDIEEIQPEKLPGR